VRLVAQVVRFAGRADDENLGQCLHNRNKARISSLSQSPLIDRSGGLLDRYVLAVDGKDVSAHGRSFDLLPGCHIVVTPSKSGTMDSTGRSLITTGPRKFAIG